MLTERVSKSDRQLGERAVNVYRFLKRAGLTGVDFDVAPEHLRGKPRSFERTEQALTELNELARINPDSPFSEYLRRKAAASVTSVRAALGEFFPLAKYLRMTLQSQDIIPPSDDQFATQRAAVASMFLDLDSRNKSYDPEGWRRHVKNHGLQQGSLRDAFASAHAKFSPLMGEILGENREIVYQVILESVADYYQCWSTGQQDQLTLRINHHPLNAPLWIEGREEVLIAHEELHLRQGRRWRENILKGRISPGYGITTTPGPEQVGLEGLAVALPYVIKPIFEAMSSHGKFATDYSWFTWAVYARAHFSANVSEPDMEKIADFVQYHLPGEPRARILSQLTKRRTDSRDRSYLMSYWKGGQYFKDVASGLSEPQAILLVQRLSEMPKLPKQIREEVENIVMGRTVAQLPLNLRSSVTVSSGVQEAGSRATDLKDMASDVVAEVIRRIRGGNGSFPLT